VPWLNRNVKVGVFEAGGGMYLLGTYKNVACKYSCDTVNTLHLIDNSSFLFLMLILLITDHGPKHVT